jgi:hypothetical protein
MWGGIWHTDLEFAIWTRLGQQRQQQARIEMQKDGRNKGHGYQLN